VMAATASLCFALLGVLALAAGGAERQAPGDAHSYDFYKRLGVSSTVSPKQLKQAFRRAALYYHPDKNKDDDAEVQFRNVYEAYETLVNPDTRRAYDAAGPQTPPPTNNNNNNQQQQQQQQQQQAPPRDFKFDYHEFYRTFDEAMAKHHEEHAKALRFDPDGQSPYGAEANGMDEHMRAHLAAAAAAHDEALRTAHHQQQHLGVGNSKFSGNIDAASSSSSASSPASSSAAEVAMKNIFKTLWEDMDDQEKQELETLRSSEASKTNGMHCKRVTKREGSSVTTVTECSQDSSSP
jgi:DnaJ-class molecular chaperone